MRCNEIAPYLEDLLDGELDEASSPVRDHLAVCPDCRRRLDWLSASREAFRSLPPERPRNGFDRRLAERIASETGVEVLPRRRPLQGWRQRPSLQWALAASILAAVLGGSFFFRNLPSGPPLPAGDRVAQEEAVPAPAPRAAPAAPAPIAPEAPAAPERRAEASPLRQEPREEPRSRSLRAARGLQPPARQAVPVPPPAAEYFEEDKMAGLDAPPVLGYVQAQDLPVSYRCQLDSTQEGCGPRGMAQVECEGFRECGGSGAAHIASLAADLSEAAAMD